MELISSKTSSMEDVSIEPVESKETDTEMEDKSSSDYEILEMNNPGPKIEKFGPGWQEELKDVKQEHFKNCPRCTTPILEEDLFCRKCGSSILKPGKTYDIRDIKFPSPFSQIQSLPATQAFDKHSQAPPMNFGSGTDISKDHDLNEWVFNHLPLTEEQKEKIKTLLERDQKLSDRKKELVSSSKEQMFKAREKIRQSRRKKDSKPIKLDNEKQTRESCKCVS